MPDSETKNDKSNSISTVPTVESKTAALSGARDRVAGGAATLQKGADANRARAQSGSLTASVQAEALKGAAVAEGLKEDLEKNLIPKINAAVAGLTPNKAAAPVPTAATAGDKASEHVTPTPRPR